MEALGSPNFVRQSSNIAIEKAEQEVKAVKRGELRRDICLPPRAREVASKLTEGAPGPSGI